MRNVTSSKLINRGTVFYEVHWKAASKLSGEAGFGKVRFSESQGLAIAKKYDSIHK